MYVLKRLELRNIMSHFNTSIDFREGFTAIVGRNGAGKSTILEAILFSITPHQAPRRSSMISENSSRGEIYLALQSSEGRLLELRNKLIRRGGGTNTEAAIITLEGRRIASKPTGYKEEIHKILGLRGLPNPASYIEKAIIISQGGLQTLAEILSEPKELRDLLDAALGYALLKQAISNIGDVVLGVSPDGSPVKLGSKSITRLQSGYMTLRNEVLGVDREIREASKRLEELEREREELERRARDLESEAKALQSEIGKLETMEEMLVNVTSMIRSERSKLDTINTRLRYAESKISSIDDLEKRRAELRAKASLAHEVAELARLQSRLDKLGRDLEMIRDAVEKLEVSRRLKEIESARREAENRLLEARSSIKEEQRRYTLLDYRVTRGRSIVTNIRRVLSECRSKDLCGSEKPESVLERLDAVINDLESKARALDQEASALEAEARRLVQALSMLEESGGSARCPVCGAELPPGRAEAIARHYRHEAERLRKAAKEKAAEAEKARAEASRLQDKRRRIELLLSRLNQLEEGLRELGFQTPEDLAKAEQKLRMLRERLEELRKLENSLEEKVRNLSREEVALREAKTRALEVLQRLGIKEEEAREKLKTLSSESKKLERMLVSKAEDLATRLGITAYRSLDDLLEKAREALEGVDKELSAIERRLEEARRLKEEAAKLKWEAEQVMKRLEELEAEEKKLRKEVSRKSEIEARLKEVQNTLAELDDRISRIDREMGELQTRIREMKSRKASGEEALKLYLPAAASRRIMEEIGEIAYRRLLAVLEDEMNDILSRFNLDVAGVEIREKAAREIEVKAIGGNGAYRPLEAVSGGERTVLALSFVLALNKAVGGKLGFLALDEPTANLDEDRRRSLVEVLRGISVEGLVRQLVVVTHHEDVRDYADTICLVTRTQQGSRVECTY
ncbi:DNA double-strand break repair rad50 ATPase [Aeropyrum pernix K1]|uniref:DNA double-strand break repair Rad50 ATPase n=1 Tax=Aeropyrum pernix (strain ATCC 700893 / DSM 11879 / JCM 9820 / NBRC 100138 / K1) TaxID=272557 RepID=RAD50_AERPE|nr:SMC family ATPase [Aeropyrum pernix]Q9YFZ1.1 RecName: Full=DNA double-strand break repair Rad50 ATPase [Aeropyrum pernix K1]BAA79020.1 DNA double-strand break repair rad50 ATPase [Aeropyrum pernix K1]